MPVAIPIHQVDAFTSRVFGGNPAAVCPLAAWLDDAVMQAVATENNLSETAFFVPLEPGIASDADYHIRWFTPESEIDLCGHATLAAAHVLFTEIEPERARVVFHSQSGPLAVARDGERLVMDFPSWRPAPVAAPQALLEGLGGPAPREVLATRDYLVVYACEADVAALSPDFALLSGLDRLGVIVTAPGDTVDFVSRFFAPNVGITEDPVTGSAHSTLVPYWAARLGKTELEARQISRRGGELSCRFRPGASGRDDRVLIAGNAVSYMKGTILL